MKDNKNQTKVQVSIINIKVVDFAINSTKYNGPQKINREDFIFNVSGANKLNVSSKSISILIGIEMMYRKKNVKIKPQTICKLKAEIEFEIKNFSEIIKKSAENKYKVPQALIEKMITTSIATSRGIIFAKLSGTLFEKIYLPPIDPQVSFAGIKSK